MEETELNDEKVKPFFAEFKARIREYVKAASKELEKQIESEAK